MDSRLYKALWFGVSTAIIGAMVYFADVGQFLDAVRTANGWFLIPAFGFGLAVFGVWSYVWYSFFTTMELGISYPRTLEIFMAGHFLDGITPLGQFGGEPFMAYMISRNTETRYERSLSTVVSADIVNTIPHLTFLFSGAAYLVLFGSLKQIIVEVVYISILATVFGGVIVYLLWFNTGKIEGAILSVLEFFSGLLGRGQGLVDTAEEKLENIEASFETIGADRAHLAKVIVVSHSYFLMQLGCLFFILLSLGINSNFTPLYFVLVLSSLGNFTPTPGGSGTFEALMAGLITVFLPMSFASALVAAILFRLTTYWPGLLFGYISLNTLENGRPT